MTGSFFAMAFVGIGTEQKLVFSPLCIGYILWKWILSVSVDIGMRWMGVDSFSSFFLSLPADGPILVTFFCTHFTMVFTTTSRNHGRSDDIHA
jgi:hypothetical protein